MFHVPLAIAILCLAGCANYDYAIDQYGGVPVTSFEHRDTTFRVFDKPSEGRVMITPSLGSTAGTGFVRGLTLGLVGEYPSEPVMRSAIEAYLVSTNRSCRAEPGQLLMQPQWEFRYSCTARTAASPPATVEPVRDQ